MTLMSLLIKVQRWLMQPHVWRFVGFASTVVALLCYALSSSFTHLFGGWNLWKICVYSVLSFIVCFAVLYAKVWQPSNSIRFKAHMAFFVLTITSVYSFFYDKVVNKKPDAYSLISCAAFAVMSLSLSRQTHFGFEVDLLYFFLGALTVQIMKIELLLGFVGACFGYSLIILRSSLNNPPERDYIGILDQHHVTVQVDTHSQVANPDIDVIMPQLTASVEANEYHTVPLFEKYLTKSEIILERLYYPTEHLAILPFKDGYRVAEFHVSYGAGELPPYLFCCVKRSKEYHKPTISKGWSSVVRDKGLKAGDRLTFYMEKNDPLPYYIEVHRYINGVWSLIP